MPSKSFPEIHERSCISIRRIILVSVNKCHAFCPPIYASMALMYSAFFVCSFRSTNCIIVTPILDYEKGRYRAELRKTLRGIPVDWELHRFAGLQHICTVPVYLAPKSSLYLLSDLSCYF